MNKPYHCNWGCGVPETFHSSLAVPPSRATAFISCGTRRGTVAPGGTHSETPNQTNKFTCLLWK